MDIKSFPQPPINIQSYTSDGKPVQAQMYQSSSGSLGASFSGLIGNQVTVPKVPVAEQIIPVEKKKRGRKKKDEDGAIIVSPSSDDNKLDSVDSKDIVENTVYADTYMATNDMTYGIIRQADELLGDCKQELDYIRSQRSMKGKYHYMNATITSMSSLLSTKLAAVKEINSTIKTVNDNEYRRFKDMRTIDQGDDNKMIMDAYNAFISAPISAPEYHLPGTTAITGGLNGIIRADYPANIQQNMDAGMASYIANATPEENLMLVDSNKDIEEVIIWDQTTGIKKFQWMNTRTGEYLNNLPPSSNLTIEDYVIDPVKLLAKNTNLNSIKKVVRVGESDFNQF